MNISTQQMLLFFARHFAACIFVLALGMSVNTHAQLNLCSSPCVASQTVTPGIDATLNIQWRGEVELEGNAATIGSKDGAYTVNRAIIGSVGVPLSVTINNTARGGAVIPFAINEALVVPAEISRRAASMGVNQLNYTRTFIVNGISQTASFGITLNQLAPNFSRSIVAGSSPGATALALNRIELRFNTGKQVEVVSPNAELSVIATINFDRAGMLDAVWEVATPETSTGQALFRPLKNVRQVLAAGRQLSIRSPALPTKTSGVYRIRLRVIRPQLDDAAGEILAPVTISYEVGQGRIKKSIDTAALITLDLPAANTVLNGDTAFSWGPTHGAQAYQIEFFDSATPDTLRPLTGLQLLPKQTRATLTVSVLNRLLSGKIYYWRVVAFDDGGRVMAASELRAIQTQP